MHKYRVWLRSVPGMHELYDGSVDVLAEDEDEATVEALRKLRRTSFPDRSASAWHVEKIERVFD